MLIAIFLLAAVYFLGLVMTHEASTNTWNFKWPIEAAKELWAAITLKNVK